MKQVTEKTICLVDGCGRQARSLGLCSRDLMTATRLIARKEVTRAELVANGKMLKSQRQFSRAKRFFLDSKKIEG